MLPEKSRSKLAVVILASAVLELCLGTFYAWSIFKNPLMHEPYKWDPAQVQWPMTLNAIFTGLAAFLVGARADRSPRSVALWSGILWGLSLLAGGYSISVRNPLLLNLS